MGPYKTNHALATQDSNGAARNFPDELDVCVCIRLHTGELVGVCVCKRLHAGELVDVCVCKCLHAGLCSSSTHSLRLRGQLRYNLVNR